MKFNEQKRYERNIGTLTREENEILKGKKVCIVGCGGLGGHILNQLLRIGVGEITIIDGDHFTDSNLNRQLLSTENNIGEAKVDVARRYGMRINADVKMTVRQTMLTPDNAFALLKGHDIVMDAVDNIESRIMMEQFCEELNIPIMHGAIQEWYVQAAFVRPGSQIIKQIYDGQNDMRTVSCLAFVPSFCASIQVAECIKYLCDKPLSLDGKMLYFDLLSMEIEVTKL